jgi:hypothetical protein
VWGSPKGVSSGETAESIGLCGLLSNTFIGGVTNVWHSASKNLVQMPVALRSSRVYKQCWLTNGKRQNQDIHG